MANDSVIVFTAARAKAIEDNAIVSGAVSGSSLILTRNNGVQINAGNVRGPAGTGTTPDGPAGGALSGTYPNPTLAANAVLTAAINALAVTTAKLADNAVTVAKLDPNAAPSQLPAGGINYAALAYSATGYQRYGSGASEDTTHSLVNGMSINTQSLYIPVAGYYLVTGSVSFAAGSNSSAGRRGVAVSTGTAASPDTNAGVSNVVTLASNASGTLTATGTLYATAGSVLSLYRYTDVANHYGTSSAQLRAVRVA